MSTTKEQPIPREKALDAIVGMLGGYVKGAGAGAKNVVVITGSGMSGKTTFLLNDVKGLVESSYKDSLAWSYVTCDAGTPRYAKACLLFELALSLQKAGFRTPVLRAALVEYNRCENGALRKRYGAVWDSWNGALARIGEVTVVASVFINGLNAFVSNVPNVVQMDPYMRDYLGIVVEGLNNASEALDKFTNIYDVISLVCGQLGKRLKDDPSFKVKAHFDEMFRSQGIETLEAGLEAALAFDMGMGLCEQDGAGRKAVVAIDGIERLVVSEGRSGRVPWLERFIRRSGAFFILSGRTLELGLLGDEYEEVTLDGISEGEFETMLSRPLTADDRSLLAVASDLPGVLAAYADGVSSGLWDGFEGLGDKPEPGRVGRLVVALKRLVPHLRKGKFAGKSPDELLRDLSERFERALKTRDGGRDWQVLAQLSWIPEWSVNRAVSVLTALSVSSEFIDNIRGFSFVLQVPGGEGLYRIHPVIAPYFRALTREATWDEMLRRLERALGNMDIEDREVKGRMLDTAIRLRVGKCHRALDAIGRGTYLVDDEIEDSIPNLIARLDSCSGRKRLQNKGREQVICKLVEELLGLVRLMIDAGDNARAAGPKNALCYLDLAINVLQWLIDNQHDLEVGVSGCENLCPEIALAFSRAHRAKGAVLSDQYRNVSDITYHLGALANEIDSIRALLRIAPEEWKKCARGKCGDELAACFNAIAISTYRIKRYDVAVPLVNVAYAMCEVDGSTVTKKTKSRVLNNYGAVRYSMEEDLTSPGASLPPEVHIKPDGEDSVEYLRDQFDNAIGVYERAFEESKSQGQTENWESTANWALLLWRSGKRNQALNVINGLRDRIIDRGQGGSNYMARCLLVRARILLDKPGGIDGKMEVGKSGGEKQGPARDGELVEAMQNAMDAWGIKKRRKGKEHVDLPKIEAVIIDVLAAMNELVGNNEPAAMGLANKVNTTRAKRQPSLRMGVEDCELKVVGLGRGPLSKNPRPAYVVASLLARGDDVDIDEILGISDPAELQQKRFGEAMDYRPKK
ncbi:hypothetical protein [Collinsella sp. An2]|uniref:hypothetical protein n=1 Tax=Collinsella sp. An2 TaxID=1965585 RepID=UPI000B39D3A9|nr:hypothetical protein [Collinsella sp. An2]OUP08477.1 hypothetical protein B5F33_07200 [Collinsella sp. An2]